MDVDSLFRLRVGQGYDVHQLIEGRPLKLGGVVVPSDKGLLGHSDADALLHAITDAVFGAAAMGDIGQHFSDRNPQYKDADSGVLLQTALKLVAQRGFRLINIDSTVICQTVRLAPHIPAMRSRLAELTGLALNRVNVKAKTNEQLGYLGRGEAIEAQATVLMFDSTMGQEQGGGE